MNLRLKGKTALVTGASRGIGRAIAAEFAGAGASVMICSRNEEVLASAARDIGGDVDWCVANAGDDDAATAAVDRTIEQFGQLDILVNNAATNPYFGPLMSIESMQMAKTVDVNVRAIVSWSQLAWYASMRERGGVIINIASIGGFSVEPDIGYYNATKAAVIQLTRQLAVELGPDVRVVGVAPGLVKTEMAAALWNGREVELGQRIPRGRLGTPEDIGRAALFLASGAADWITGTTIVVDGGQHLATLLPTVVGTPPEPATAPAVDPLKHE